MTNTLSYVNIMTIKYIKRQEVSNIINMTIPHEKKPAADHKQVKVSVGMDVAIAFKEACVTSNITMASKLAQFMADYSKTVMKRKPASDYTTRRQRRTAIKKIIGQLEQIKSFEERYRDRIPENLQGSAVYDTAEEYVSSMEEAIELLSSI